MTYVTAIGFAFLGVGFATLILAILAHAGSRSSRQKFTLSMVGAVGGLQVIVGAVLWGIVILNEVAAYYVNH